MTPDTSPVNWRNVDVKEKIQRALQLLQSEVHYLESTQEKLGRLKERTRIINIIKASLKSSPERSYFEFCMRHKICEELITELTEGNVQ